MEAIQKFLENTWQFLDNRQELLVLILTVILGGVAALARWVWSYLKKPRSRPISADTFPFEVIKPGSSKVLQQLQGSVGGDENDPLELPHSTLGDRIGSYPKSDPSLVETGALDVIYWPIYTGLRFYMGF